MDPELIITHLAFLVLLQRNDSFVTEAHPMLPWHKVKPPGLPRPCIVYTDANSINRMLLLTDLKEVALKPDYAFIRISMFCCENIRIKQEYKLNLHIKKLIKS